MVPSPTPRELSDELHARSVVIDCCCQYLTGYNDHLKQSGLTVLNVTVIHPWDGVAEAMKNIAEHHRTINNDPGLRLIRTTEDIFRAKAEGAVGAMIGWQDSTPLTNNIGMAEQFHRLGTRIIQLSYSARNHAADGCWEPTNAGLSSDGKALVRELNRVGIVVDCTHVGERSSLDAIEISEKPVIFSHSNPRARCNVSRNITDETIKAVAAKGGVVCLTMYPPLNWVDKSRRPTLEDYLDNLEYVIDLVGIDHVGVGTDNEATPGAANLKLRMALRTKFSDTYQGYFETFPEIAQAPPSLIGWGGQQDFPAVTHGLMRRGYDSDAIQKILGLNLVRVFKEVWGA